jgi:hypothetical protein
MSASNTCDGCSVVISPTDPELEEWLILHVPLEPEPEPDIMTNPMAMITAFANGGRKPHYQRLEFCSWRCVSAKALTMTLSQELTFNALKEDW